MICTIDSIDEILLKLPYKSHKIILFFIIMRLNLIAGQIPNPVNGANDFFFGQNFELFVAMKNRASQL